MTELLSLRDAYATHFTATVTAVRGAELIRTTVSLIPEAVAELRVADIVNA